MPLIPMKRWAKRLLIFSIFLFILLRQIGLFNYLYLTSVTQMDWPPSFVVIRRQVKLSLEGKPAEIPPIYRFQPEITPNCALPSVNNSILVVVRSAPDRIERRQAIRSTWGLNGMHFETNTTFQTIFVMGIQLGLQWYDNELREEHGKFGDLLVGSFIDHYDNATLKTQHALSFAAEPHHCNNAAAFTLFLDDDELLLPWNLASDLNGVDPEEHLSSGDSVEGVHPARTVFSKWQITLEEYPFDHYPPYVQGNAFLISRRTAKEFAAAIQYTKPMIWDDVYLGIIALALGIEVTKNAKIVRNPGWMDDLTKMIAIHGYTADEIRHNYIHFRGKFAGRF